MSGRKSLKGVSPLVAVITLIAFTLIVAGFLASWATTFTRSQTSAIEFCMGADAIIQGATYDEGSETLNLFVNNRGDVNLTFDVILTYGPDDAPTKHTGFSADFGELATFTITGVTSDLTEATIEGKPCRSAQDFIGRSWINGL